MSDRRPARSGTDGPRKRSTGAHQRGSAPQRGSSGTTKPSQPTRLPPQREKPAAASQLSLPVQVPKLFFTSQGRFCPALAGRHSQVPLFGWHWRVTLMAWR